MLAVINAGYLLSYWTGGLLTIALGISGEPDSFGNLWKLILIAACSPLISLLFLIILPNEKEMRVSKLLSAEKDENLKA